MTTIDAHVHLWEFATDPQPWIDAETMSVIDRDFTTDDLGAMLDGCRLERAVLVQTTNSADETKRMLRLPAERIAGVVGWLDLTAEVDAQLDALSDDALARFVGVRHLVHVDDDPRWLARREVAASLDRLAAHGIGFDLVLRAWQLPLAGEVVAAHPDTRFVLDHLGGIAETDDESGWESGLRALAAQPNVMAKLSGLAAIEQSRLPRLFGIALEAFGPRRLMYGSDWPLAEMGVGATAWFETVASIVDELSTTERERILGGTATEHYRLEGR